MSFMSTPDLHSHKTTAQPTSQQKTWHSGMWKMDIRLQRITYVIPFPAIPEKLNTGKWIIDADCLKFIEAEISKTLGQKNYDIVNCWLLKGKKDLTKVSLSCLFRRNPRRHDRDSKAKCHLSFMLQSDPSQTTSAHSSGFVIGGYGCMNAKTIGEISYFFF